MKKNHRILTPFVTALLILITLVLLPSSCKGGGIFYTLENEVQIFKRGLSETIGTLKMVQLTTTVPEDYYVAQAGTRLWRKNPLNTPEDWTRMAMPPGLNDRDYTYQSLTSATLAGTEYTFASGTSNFFNFITGT